MDCCGFFILINSRVFLLMEVKVFIVEIIINVKKVVVESGKVFEIVLCGDLILCGYLFEEFEVVEELFGRFDGWVFVLFFC